jgi:hypothetical protein
MFVIEASIKFGKFSSYSFQICYCILGPLVQIIGSVETVFLARFYTIRHTEHRVIIGLIRLTNLGERVICGIREFPIRFAAL